MTIEDPVEYELEGIGQTQVNAKVEMTFARGLRAILRQDPDVVLVGEIRDGETAQIAVQASLTGHLVLSTLHTNSALGAISRLQDMGVEPFLLSTSLLAVMSQRLVRHKGPSQSDYKSVFLFNIAVSAVLYGVLVALAPLAARWYGMPEIARIAPVFFLLLPLNALCAVQNTIFIRQFRFALLSKETPTWCCC